MRYFLLELYYDSALTLLLKALLSPLDLIVFASERFLIFGLSSIIFLQFVRGESFKARQHLMILSIPKPSGRKL